MSDTAHPARPPLFRKLGIKAGDRLGLIEAPAGWALVRLPADVRLARDPTRAEIIVAFFRNATELAERLPELADRIRPDRSLWVAWPRRAGGHSSDITDNLIRQLALPIGIVDVKVAALDADWSGLKLVWRIENR